MCLEVSAQIADNAPGRIGAKRLGELSGLVISSSHLDGLPALHFSVSGGCSCEFLARGPHKHEGIWELEPKQLAKLVVAIRALNSGPGAMAPSDYGAVFTGCLDVPLVWLVSWRPFGEIGMSYILADQRDRDVVSAFAAYREYLLERRSRFPPAAYALAASEWYFDFSDRRCPHDSWLESVTMREPSMGARHEQRTSTLTIRLLGAYHDGYIEFSYPEVYDYDLRGAHVGQGHGDWRYDEFRLIDSGRVVHEIEWASFDQSNRWLIEASDVFHRWIPGVPKMPV